MKQKKAVLALCERDGKVLGVSRKGDSQDFGLPGGKVDPGETLVEALRRELFEETGLDLVSSEEVYTGMEGDYQVTTFRCVVQGSIHTAESGRVEWVSWETLGRGSFGRYNSALFLALPPHPLSKG